MSLQWVFWVFANFYQRLIRNYSQVAALLTSLTSSTIPFTWSPNADKACWVIKELFTSLPSCPIPAFYYGSGCLWLWSGSSSISEIAQGWKASLLHLLFQMSIPWREKLRRGKPWTPGCSFGFGGVAALSGGSGSTFCCVTDLKNLTNFCSAKRQSCRQARWAQFLGRFSFTLTHFPGPCNIKPDALSPVLLWEDRDRVRKHPIPCHMGYGDGGVTSSVLTSQFDWMAGRLSFHVGPCSDQGAVMGALL